MDTYSEKNKTMTADEAYDLILLTTEPPRSSFRSN